MKRTIDGFRRAGLAVVAFALLRTPVMSEEAASERATGRAYGTVQAAAFSPDGSRLALAGSNRRVHLLAMEDGSEKHALLIPGGSAVSVAFAPVGRHLVAGGYNRLYIWDSETGKPIRAVDTDARRIVALAFSPDGKRLAAAGSDGTIRLFDTDTWAETERLSTGAGESATVVFSPDGKRLAGAGGRQALVWHAEGGAIERRVPHSGGQVSGLAFTDQGQGLVVAGSDGRLALWAADPETPSATARHHRGRINALALSGDNRILASAGQGRIVFLHCGRTLEPLHRFDPFVTEPTCLAVSRNGEWLVVGLRAPRQSFALWRLSPETLFAGGGIVPVEGIDADYLTRLEKEIVAEQNLARTKPAAYAEFARAYRRGFQGNIHVSGSTRRRTQEGVAAVDEAIAFLDKARPVRPLAPSKGLSLAAADHVRDTGPRGMVGHDGSDKSRPADRISRHGQWQQRCAENIAYGFSTAREIVLQLIIDDGVPDRGHRINIYNPDFRVTGVNVGPHKQYRTMAVITYAGGMKER